MITVLIVLGVLVGLILGGILPWLLLRKLEREDQGTEEKLGRDDQEREEG